MKILFILPAFYPSNKGTPAGIREKCRTLSAAGHQPVVVCYHRYQALPPYAKVYRIPANPFYKKGSGPALSRLWLDWLLFLRAAAVIRRERPDIIHAVGQEGALIAAQLRRIFKIPFVFEIASSMANELVTANFSGRRGLLTALAARLDKNLPRQADFNLTVSRRIYRQLAARKLPAELVGDTLDLDFFRPQTREKGPKIIVGYQGSLAPIQNIALLLKIAPEINRVNPNIVFKIGTETGAEELAQEIVRRGLAKCVRVEKVPLARVPAFINACDLMVIPRRLSVGTPLKLLNYLACGRAVIAFREIAENLTTADVIYKVADDLGFKLAILKLAGDRTAREEYGRRALSFARQNFSRQKQYQSLLSIYQRTLASGE